MLQKRLITAGLLVVCLWAFNSSRLTGPADDGATRVLSHRGVHQIYDRENLGRDACTAERIYEPRHDFLENTIASMQSAFAAGADVVELDIHLTQDGHFAVFHDWTLDCRTEGAGLTEDAMRAALKELDIGYGYTADGGQTYPFRGRFVGAMPMLDEVFEVFPSHRFLINLKSNDVHSGEAFAAFITAHPEWRQNVYGFYGGPRSIEGAQVGFPDLNGFSTAQTKTCLKSYALWGWSGYVPAPCRKTQVLVPISHARYLWGWPHKFTTRMKASGSVVMVAGPYEGRRWGIGGVNSTQLAAQIPLGFDGFVWTDKAELIGPYLENQE